MKTYFWIVKLKTRKSVRSSEDIFLTKKEAKESIHWLELIEEANPEFKLRMRDLKQEAIELKNILSSIIINRQKNINKEKNKEELIV